MLSIESNIYNDLVFDKEMEEFVQFRVLFDKCKEQSRNYAIQTSNSALKPVDYLVGLFAGPNLLIAKRGDKLVDYEAALSDYQTKSNNGTTPIPKEVNLVTIRI